MAESMWFRRSAIPEIDNAYLVQYSGESVRMLHFLGITDAGYEFGLGEAKSRFMARNTPAFLNAIEHRISVLPNDWHSERTPFVIMKAYRDWQRIR